MVISEPGVYDIAAADYHADPVVGGSLSSTGARMLLPPSCPAKFDHWRRHPDTDRSDTFDLGRAAHRAALGAGDDLEVIEAPDWRTKAARERRAAAYAAGRIPVLAGTARTVRAMAEALRQSPVARALLGVAGRPEQTLVWLDPATGVVCRAMLDWLPDPVAGRRLIVVDYKTTESAEPYGALQRSVFRFRYHIQAAWYLSGVRALGLDEDPAMVFLAQEKTPPFLVTAVQLDADAYTAGAAACARARATYAECSRTGVWPGYSEQIELIPTPAWVMTEGNE